MPKFRKKPVEVDAVQFNASGDHPEVHAVFVNPGDDPAFCVMGRQGYVLVYIGDWIISEPDGSGHYPCAPDIFAATYEPA